VTSGQARILAFGKTASTHRMWPVRPIERSVLVAERLASAQQ
jgi:hypothetical protein